MLHVVFGYDAVGIPQVEISIWEDVFACWMTSGMSGRWGSVKLREEKKECVTYTEKPHTNTRDIYQKCVDSSSRVCETFTVAIRLVYSHNTSRSTGAIKVTASTWLRCGIGMSTARGCVNGYLVIRHLIDAFDYINFSWAWPFCFGSKRPERRPYLSGSKKKENLMKKRGHTEQPKGICTASIMIRDPMPYKSVDVRRT